MDFLSTRGGAPRVSAAEAVLRGLAPDGGLYLPERPPVFSPEERAALYALPYPALAARVLARFLPGFAPAELEEACAVYAGFHAPEVAPMRPVRPLVWSLELWHGPTAAFKDFALQLLPRLLTAAARQCGDTRTRAILVATSGDTGKAALAGFAGVPGTRVGVFYPAGGVSAVQRLQMVTQQGDNVAVWGVDGNFDDAQGGVKALMRDARLAARLDEHGLVLSSANSINWGRLAPQIAYYFWAYGRLLREGAVSDGDPVDFCVPTGNFGDLLAGYYAKCAGLPVGRLICASNRNNVLTTFVRTGRYDRRRTLYRTESPSMDILVSSNLERLLYLLTRDSAAVARWMEALARDGFYDVGPQLCVRLAAEISAYSCDDRHAASTAGELWTRFGYLCDPHTAVAMDALAQHRALTGERRPTVVLSTASPFKFPHAVLAAIDIPFTGSDFERLEALSILSGQPVPPELAALRTLPVLHGETVARGAMKAAAERWLLP